MYFFTNPAMSSVQNLWIIRFQKQHSQKDSSISFWKESSDGQSIITSNGYDFDVALRRALLTLPFIWS